MGLAAAAGQVVRGAPTLSPVPCHHTQNWGKGKNGEGQATRVSAIGLSSGAACARAEGTWSGSSVCHDVEHAVLYAQESRNGTGKGRQVKGS